MVLLSPKADRSILSCSGVRSAPVIPKGRQVASASGCIAHLPLRPASPEGKPSLMIESNLPSSTCLRRSEHGPLIPNLDGKRRRRSCDSHARDSAGLQRPARRVHNGRTGILKLSVSVSRHLYSNGQGRGESEHTAWKARRLPPRIRRDKDNDQLDLRPFIRDIRQLIIITYL
jgi:hypothetical protein